MMLGELMLHAVRAHHDDLRRGAGRRRRFADPDRGRCTSAVTLRYGFPGDAAALQRLGIDGAELVLLAEVCGEPRAALSLDSGAVVAHPAHGDLADLLLTRAAQLRPRAAGAVTA